MSKILIFGASGGLGSCIVNYFSNFEHTIIPISTKDIDFNSDQSYFQIELIIEENKPDIIINCAGILGDNEVDFNKIFNINLRANWFIAKYYMSNYLFSKPVKLIFIGSSAYLKGKKDYILYASTKAALFNLYEGLSNYFSSSNIIIGLVNPSRIDTNMISHLEKNPNLEYLDPKKLAITIINFISSLKESSYVNIDK